MHCKYDLLALVNLLSAKNASQVERQGRFSPFHVYTFAPFAQWRKIRCVFFYFLYFDRRHSKDVLIGRVTKEGKIYLFMCHILSF